MTQDAHRAPPPINSILHPTDFSDASRRAFANALAIALLRQTQLTLLHVGSEARPDASWSRFPAVRQTLEAWGLLAPGSAQEDVAEQLDVLVSKVILKGSNPAAAIADYLERVPHDLIVLATEGQAGLPNWLSSSDSESIARRTRTPTLFVPRDAQRGLVSLRDGSYTMRRILLPIDHKPDFSAALEFAQRAATIFGEQAVRIRLLHIGDGSLAWPATVSGPDLEFDTERRQGDVVEEILASAQEHDADLIIMPTAGREGFLELTNGSTTEHVLRRARCPVLAVPAG